MDRPRGQSTGRVYSVRQFTRLTVISATFLFTLAVAGSETGTITCRADKGGGKGWSWRTIDGKQCWYRGPAGVEKDRLRWAPKQRPRPVVVADPENEVETPAPVPKPDPRHFRYKEVPVRTVDPGPALNPPKPESRPIINDCPTAEVWPPLCPISIKLLLILCGLSFAIGGLLVSLLWLWASKQSQRVFRN